MSCDCTAKMDARLAERGMKLSHCFGITDDNQMVARLMLQTEKISKGSRSKSSAPIVIATHCPFCGEAQP